MKRALMIASLAGLAFPAMAQTPPAATPPPAMRPPDPPKPPGPPKPAPENAALGPYAKNWTCDSKTHMPDGKEGHVKATFRVGSIANGFWLSANYDAKKTKDYLGFSGAGTIGWDAVQKKYLFIGFDSNGGWINLSSASPGDKITWTGEGHAPMGTVPMQFTWNLKSPKELNFAIEVTPPGAPGPVTTLESSCKAK